MGVLKFTRWSTQQSKVRPVVFVSWMPSCCYVLTETTPIVAFHMLSIGETDGIPSCAYLLLGSVSS